MRGESIWQQIDSFCCLYLIDILKFRREEYIYPCLNVFVIFVSMVQYIQTHSMTRDPSIITIMKQSNI